MDRRFGKCPKEEPTILWEDRHMAVLAKTPGWVCSVSSDLAQNRALSKPRYDTLPELVGSGKAEHLIHFIMLRYKDEKQYELSNCVEHEFGLAHRLDVDTSGCLMMGKTKHGFGLLRNSFSTHGVFKEYMCLVHGSVENQRGEVAKPIARDEVTNVSYISENGQWAKSMYEVMGKYRLKGTRKIFTLCRVVIVTGRTHQIRLHMTSIGHPLVADNKYNRKLADADTMWCPRLFLHAWRIGFRDSTRTWKEVSAPLTRDLARALRILEQIQLDGRGELGPSLRVVRPAQGQENAPPPNAGVSAANRSQPTKPEPAKPVAPTLPSIAEVPNKLPWCGPHGVAPPPPPLPSSESIVLSPELQRLIATRPELQRLLGHRPELQHLFTNGKQPHGPAPPPPPPKAIVIPAEAPAPGATPPPPPPKARASADGGAGRDVGPPPVGPPPVGPPPSCPPPPAPQEEDAWEEAGGKRRPAAAKAGKRQNQPAQQPKAAKKPPPDAGLEDLCVNLAMRALLNSKKSQSSVGQLGNHPEIVALMQQMGPRRPKLSKILRDRPDTFVFLGNDVSEPIVTLSQRAMALARMEQVSSLKAANEASAVEAAQKATVEREKIMQKEKEIMSSLPPAPPSRRQPAGNAPWASSGESGAGSYDHELSTLVEMGFERPRALHALRMNYGDMMEAMDMLSGGGGGSAGDPTLAEAAAAAGDAAEAEEAEDEEKSMREALALSQKEEKARKRRQDLDDRAFEAALAQSMGGVPGKGSASSAECEEDRELREALALSRRAEKESEEEGRRMQEEENEELERAMAESARHFELLFAGGNEAFEETIRQSLRDAEGCASGSGLMGLGMLGAGNEALEEELMREALKLSYNDADDGEEIVFTPHLDSCGQVSEGGGSSSSSSYVAPACVDPPAKVTFRPEERASQAGASSSSSSRGEMAFSSTGKAAAASSSSSSAAAPEAEAEEEFSLKKWLLDKAEELRVDMDGEMLWFTLSEIDDAQLADEEVIKMWFGCDDALPGPLMQLVYEFRQTKELLSIAGEG